MIKSHTHHLSGMVIALPSYYIIKSPYIRLKECVVILLDTPPKNAKAALSQLLSGKSGDTDSETFGKMLKELSFSLGGSKGLSKEDLALLLANEEKLQEAKIAPGLLLKLDAETDGKMLQAGKSNDSVLSLLHGDEEPKLSKEELEELKMLHPKITPQMSIKDVRQLMEDAKNYLKGQLSGLVEEKEMPKTLKGLVQLAEKKGLDLTKITLEQIQPKQQSGDTEAVKSDLSKSQPLLADPKERHSGIKNIPTEELVHSKQVQKTVKDEGKKESQLLRTLLQKEESPTKPELTVNKEGVKVEKPEQAALRSENRAPQADLRSENRVEQAVVKSATQPEQIKAEVKQETFVSKTEQPVIRAQAKSNAAQHNGAKSQEQPSSTLPSDMLSDETPKNSAQKPEFAASLNQLLQGNAIEGESRSESENRPVETQTNKVSQTTTFQAKSDALELKLSEAKQMVRHFAGEIKEAIQNYKPPFTRIKIQLNPVKLGEVDVTMIQRGNNVHINISSNSAAINTLAQNATELRTQLSQNGLNNATMNFSSNANTEQQQQQQRQHLAELYEQFETGEEFELLETLEIIIPRYV